MKSHELAVEFMKMAQFLVSKEDVELPSTKTEHIVWFWGEKEEFTHTIEKMGSGKKEIKDGYLAFIPNAAPTIQFRIPRDRICHKVQEEKWECDPILTVEEFTK